MATEIIIKSLIANKSKALRDYLTTEYQSKLDGVSPISAETAIWLKPNYPIEFIDPSWFNEDEHYLATLINSPSPILSAFAKSSLWNLLKPKNFEILPLQAVKKQSLGFLLDLSKELMNELIINLGLHDLALELSKVVEKKEIDALKNALTLSQMLHLQKIKKRQKPINFGSLNLAKWDKSPNSLQKVLKQRGANRLAKALFGMDKHLMWYLSRRMNKTQSYEITTLSTDLGNQKAHLELKQELIFSYEHLKDAAS